MNKTYTLELTIEEANTVIAGLGKLPAEQCFNLIVSVQKQLQEQNVEGASVEAPVESEAA